MSIIARRLNLSSSITRRFLSAPHAPTPTPASSGKADWIDKFRDVDGPLNKYLKRWKVLPLGVLLGFGFTYPPVKLFGILFG